MPELSCTVQTCVHNYQYLCELDKIQVGGNSAKNAQEREVIATRRIR